MTKVPYKQYQSLIRHGHRVSDPFLTVFYRRADDMFFKVAVSKKVGNAVKRNRTKRWIRAILRERTDRVSYCLLVICVREGLRTYQDIEQRLDQLLSGIRLSSISPSSKG